MSIKILESNHNFIKTLNTRSREATCKVKELQQVHIRLGLLTGQAILQNYPIQEFATLNAQNKNITGTKNDHSNITVITLLRAGLYFSLGIQENISGDYAHFLSFDCSDIVQYNKHIEGRDIILVDSVINSGQTIAKYLEILLKANTVTVACLVMHSAFAKKCKINYLNYKFYTSRVSDNYYVGKGSNDTGNRLFGTK